MTDVFLSLVIIAALGYSLRYVFPDIDIDQFRRSINRLVLYIILPALIFNVVMNADIGEEFYKIPLAALAGIILSLLLAAAVYRFFNISNAAKGALIIASAFSNVTYLGLPVLQGIYSGAADKISIVAILYEVTTSPTLLSIGAIVALYYGNKKRLSLKETILRIFKLPAIWAVVLAVILKISHIPIPEFILSPTKILGQMAAGLMILSLGMVLKLRIIRHGWCVAVAVFIQLILIPIIVHSMCRILSMRQPYWEATVIEAAMPTQLLTLVVADEFNLDTELLASVIMASTIISVFTIPTIRFLLFRT
jgi:predicted permease